MQVLMRPRWAVLSIVVAIVVATFVSLGFWQLRRLSERQSRNALIEQRVGETPVDVDEAFVNVSATLDVASHEFTVIEMVGSFDPAASFMVRNQTSLGEAGFHLVAPLVGAGEFDMLVNLGWVPLGIDLADARQLIPGGSVRAVGLLRPTQPRPQFGREEPDGVLEVVNRIDIERLALQSPNPLVPFWMQLAQPDDPVALPIPIELPVIDQGPHLAYAIQWFSFATISLVGVFLLARREVKRAQSNATNQRDQAPTG